MNPVFMKLEKNDGSNYEPDTLTSFHRDIDRYLRENGYLVSILTSDLFSTSRQVLQSRRKELKQKVLGNRPNKAQPVSENEEEMLWECGQLGHDNPHALLNTVWFNNTNLLGFRGCDENRQLKSGAIELKRDENGSEYLEFSERTTKTRGGNSTHIGMSSESIIRQFTQTTAADNTMDIPVDADMTSLNISISGPTDVTDATLTDPGGVVDTFMGGTSSRWLENNTVFMALQNPAIGTWTLTRIDTSKVWDVNITATSGIHIDFRLIQTDGSGFKTIFDRNPITGHIYTFAVMASNINAAFEPLSLVLQDEEGETLTTSTLTTSYTPTRSTGHTEVTMPTSNFYIQLSGKVPGGSPFIRSSWRLVTPVSADLIVYPIIGQIGSTDDITYKLTNHASETNTYDVTMSSTVTSSITRSHIMLMADTLEDTFEITTSSNIESLSYSVTLSEPGAPTSLQSSSYTLQLASSLCTVSMTTNECDNANSSCSAYQWSATAVFNFEVSVFVVTTGVSITDDITDYTNVCLSNLPYVGGCVIPR
ncbi:uncharacterized protein LOC117315122 [Pecten maximus]|uniref:uncharacterized protein LOC117315122 n=1 Tax=Pecten maximus TaxID=6579 RepID=UPI001457FBF5|nr:uncharacterized protein LOC117315122 [Pecten maximus]